MNPKRRQRLITVLLIVFGSASAIGLLVYAARDSLNLFYPPSKLVAGDAPINRTLKAGGCVVPGSVVRSNTDLRVSFDITDGLATIGVVYTGILPDLFAEGEAAIVDGKLQQEGNIIASRVLAKHDENYMPPEVADALAEGAEHVKTCSEMSNAS